MKKEVRQQWFFISTAFGFGSFIGMFSFTTGLVAFLFGAIGMIIFYVDIDT